MMGISWKLTRGSGRRHNTNDGYFTETNERVRAQTQRKIDLTIKERRLRWLRHVLQMDDNRLPRQAVHWDISGTKRKPERPRKN